MSGFDIFEGGKIVIADQEFMEILPVHAALRHWREELGKTQQQIADESKITLRQYQRFESGERSIYGTSFAIGVRVCRALHLDPFDLVPSLS